MSKEPKPRYITPSLESITVKGKYIVPETSFKTVYKKLMKQLESLDWGECSLIGESVGLMKWKMTKGEKDWQKYLRGIRSGVPVFFGVTTIEHHEQSMLLEVECHPAMWHMIAYTRGEEVTYTENEIQEALFECKRFVKQVMSIFKGREVEPVSVYPIIPRTEIKSRLINLGLKEIVDALDKAEEHIVQNDFSESLKSSRTAFEKMIDWQMNKRGLAQTNSYYNNLERIKSKGYLDPETTKLLQTYYECLSIIVHEKGVKPGIFEAQMGYGITLIMLDYFANKLP